MSTKLSQSPAWRALSGHATGAGALDIRDLCALEAGRAEAMTIRVGDTVFDFTKALASAETVALLDRLAAQQDVAGWFARMMTGEAINTTEGRAVLHTDLRRPDAPADVVDCLARMRRLSDAVRADPDITDVVHIGIGGSDLGPRMVCEALADLYAGPRLHFVANVDPDDLGRVVRGLDPARTLVTVASKTFTTQETMLNLTAARAWLGGRDDRVIAMTANVAEAACVGITQDRVLPLWDWVGGRYSVWSAVGFPIMLACGYEAFQEFLAGAHAADLHAAQAPYTRNAPVMMAMLSVWYRSFLGFSSVAVAPYSQRLARFSDYMQQLGMESNGKRVDRDGALCDYPTSPVIFGQAGTNGQHAFFQMLHQGSDVIPVEFIGFAAGDGSVEARRALLDNMYAQADALMLGCDNSLPHKIYPGNRPSLTILLPRFTPYSLGFLLAVYEHKIAAEGFLWNINSFDQFGVELGKKLAKQRLAP